MLCCCCCCRCRCRCCCCYCYCCCCRPIARHTSSCPVASPSQSSKPCATRKQANSDRCECTATRIRRKTIAHAYDTRNTQLIHPRIHTYIGFINQGGPLTDCRAPRALVVVHVNSAVVWLVLENTKCYTALPTTNEALVRAHVRSFVGRTYAARTCYKRCGVCARCLCFDNCLLA